MPFAVVERDPARAGRYIADDEAAVREHAAAGGFPCTDVNLVSTIIDPTTGDI